MINEITLCGRVVTDLSERQTHGGTPVTSFRLMNRDGKTSKVVYIEVETWGNQAKRLSERVVKGNVVIVHGRLTQDDWQTVDGQKRTKHKVTANRVIPTGYEQKKEKEKEE